MVAIEVEFRTSGGCAECALFWKSGKEGQDWQGHFEIRGLKYPLRRENPDFGIGSEMGICRDDLTTRYPRVNIRWVQFDVLPVLTG
jgi:hypothetical protein